MRSHVIFRLGPLESTHSLILSRPDQELWMYRPPPNSTAPLWHEDATEGVPLLGVGAGNLPFESSVGSSSRGIGSRRPPCSRLWTACVAWKPPTIASSRHTITRACSPCGGLVTDQLHARLQTRLSPSGFPERFGDWPVTFPAHQHVGRGKRRATRRRMTEGEIRPRPILFGTATDVSSLHRPRAGGTTTVKLLIAYGKDRSRSAA